MTRFSKIRFGCHIALPLLLLLASTPSRIQAKRFQLTAPASAATTTAAATKSKINGALLLQTRGGWFRQKNKDTNATTLGEVDTTLTGTPQEQAAEIRKQAKALHDQGNFTLAAQRFHQAANLLEGGEEPEWATCRLHECLCCLKAEDYEGCIEAATALLDSSSGDSNAPPAMIRARAYHRRAKAKAALEDLEGAVSDARSAAFLGDRKAVAYYGTLLRDSGTEASAASLPDTSALFESLLSKSPQTTNGGGGGGGMEDLMSSALMGGLPGLSSPGGSGGSSLAKSVLSSLSKKLEDETTHDGICNYLQSTNPVQVQSMANMAGMQLSETHANKLVNFAHGITPKTIRRTVKLTKRGVWGFQLVRKILGVISKYRHLFFLAFLLQWTKSAMLRPVPVPKVKAPKIRNAGPAAPKPNVAAAPASGGPAVGTPAGQQQAAVGGKSPLTPGLLGRGAGGGLAALAADR